MSLEPSLVEQCSHDRASLVGLGRIDQRDLGQEAEQAQHIVAGQRSHRESKLNELADLLNRLGHHDYHLEDLVDTLVEVRVAVEDEHAHWQILLLLVSVLQGQVLQEEGDGLFQRETFGDHPVGQVALSEVAEALLLACFELDAIGGSESIHVLSAILVGERVLPVNEQRFNREFDRGQ